MVDRELYFREVRKIINTGKNGDMQSKFEKVYDMAARELNAEDRTIAHATVNEILEYLFKDKFSDKFSVPIDFIDGPIGKVLFTVKFGVSEDIYTTSEITAIMDVTRALVSYDLREHNIIAEKKGRNIFVYETNLMDYMRSKGMTEENILKRISLYKKYRKQGMNAEEIQQRIRDEVNS